MEIIGSLIGKENNHLKELRLNNNNDVTQWPTLATNLASDSTLTALRLFSNLNVTDIAFM
jgi:hypothetical protein